MGVFGRDSAFDLAIFSDIAKGDSKDPATKAARDILGLPRESAEDKKNKEKNKEREKP